MPVGRLRQFASHLVWLSPLALLALAFAAERLLSSANERFAILPTGTLTRWLRPGIANFDQTVLGYLLMALAAAAFAFSIRKEVFWPSAGASSAVIKVAPLHIARPAPAAIVALGAAVLIWTYILFELFASHNEWYFPFLLLSAAGIPAAILLRFDVRRRVSFRFEIELWEVAGLAAVIAAAGLILTFDLAGRPDSMVGDEGAFWTRALALSKDRQALDFFAPGVYTFPLASSMYQAVFVKVLGPSLWSWRFSSAAAVLAVMVPMYFLVRTMFDRRIAFAALALMVTSPFLLAFARLGYNNSQSLFPVVVTLLLIYVAVERKSALLFFLAGAMAGIGFYTYFADRIAIVIIPGMLAHAWFTRRLTPREAVAGLALAAVATIMIGVLPTVRAFADERSQTKLVEGAFASAAYVNKVFPELGRDSLSLITVANVDLVTDVSLWPRLWARGLIRTLLAFHRTDLVEAHYIAGSLGGPLISALLLPGLAVAFRRLREPGPALVLLWFFSAILVLGVLGAGPPAQTHLVTVIPVVAIFYAVVLSLVASSLARFIRLRRDVIATLMVAVTVIVLGTVGAREYFQNANRMFAPSLDVAIWFAAAELDPGQSVVYVSDGSGSDTYVPWGVRHFDLESRYTLINADSLGSTTQVARLRGAEVAIVDGRDPLLALQLRSFLPDWEITSRDARDDTPVVFFLRRGPDSGPTATADADPTNGLAPLSIRFRGDGSIDPYEDALAYRWDFGDGFISSLANPAHEYGKEGVYTATLVVDDGYGGSHSDSVTITVGDRAPAARLEQPLAGAVYEIGDTIEFEGSATDPEDGVLPASSLGWEVILHEGDDVRLVSTATGGGEFVVPKHRDGGRFEIVLTATDSAGLQDTKRVFIYPSNVQLTFATSPPGFSIVYDGRRLQTPVTLTTVTNSIRSLSIDRWQLQGALIATFRSWSDGGSRKHDIDTGSADGTITATLSVLDRAADGDGDGCSLLRETGEDAQLGGRRSDSNVWDFFDVNGDGLITSLGDIFPVVGAFGARPGSPDYSPEKDRSPPPSPAAEPDPNRREPWDMGPPDGVISLVTDVLGVVNQLGHDCR